nr:hypothetical protein BaRGS_001301 [Batillaria attramentaria]
MATTAMTTTTTSALTFTTLPKAATISSIPVRAIPVPNTNKLILAGPCIVLRTATVAEQVQALRQEKTVVTKPAEPQSPELLRCKRRSDISRLGFPEAKPASVSRRNARERNRVKLVNQGFETLREHVPNGKKNRKMSKVETLRSAVEYIRQMQQLLEDHDAQIVKIKVDVSDDDNMADINIDSDDSVSVADCDVDMTSSVEMPEADTTTATAVSNTSGDSDILPNNNNNNNNNNKFMNFNINNNGDVNNLNMNDVNNLNVNA